MRLLVRCPACLRQYDATGKSIGTRFRCHCGAAVTIEQPEGHDAAVVRCSSCGGPRRDDQPRCAYCGAEFTLHDRDLNTVCPACFCRVSDRAKFCHHCGTPLVPEFSLQSEPLPLFCPVCTPAKQLSSRRMGKVSVMECGQCVGLWLGSDTFQLLRHEASEAAQFSDPHARPGHARPPQTESPPGVRWRYRECPICHDLMIRRNFGNVSGVIIDVCGDHGLWFDDDELARILEWVRGGGLAITNERMLEQAQRVEADELARRRHVQKMFDHAPSTLPVVQHRGFMDDLVDAVREWWSG